jgi:alcohol dehydrogenase
MAPVQCETQMHDLLNGFDSTPRTRLVFGPGTLERIGELAGELGGSRVLLVTDSGIVKAGHVGRAKEALESVGLHVAVFDSVRENPTTLDVERCVEAARECNADLLIGLGGGSSMDTAKGCNFVLTNGGRIQDYWGVSKATKPMLPLIAVPTTAGTGSECQSFALIADEETHAKMACGDPKAAARIAILDPILTVSQPRGVTACTGIDAIAHAVETAVTRKRTAISWLYSREAFRLLIANFERALSCPDDLQARAAMLLGAAFAGTAIENSMLGAAHSMANPLTAHFGTIHGQAVGMMLPRIVRFNAELPEATEAYREMALAADLVDRRASDADAVDALIRALESCLQAAGFPESLAAAEVDKSAIPGMAGEAAIQWTATFNPRPIGAPEFETIYRAAYEGIPA